MATGGKGAVTTGQGNHIFGGLISFSIPFITCWVYQVGILHSKAPYWKWMWSLAWGNKPFTIWVLFSCMIGTIALGRMMGGGSKVADAHQFTDLDKV